MSYIGVFYLATNFRLKILYGVSAGSIPISRDEFLGINPLPLLVDVSKDLAGR